MQYKYAQRADCEALASGGVIRHGAGQTNFPVRLASEIFMRCYAIVTRTSGDTDTQSQTRGTITEPEVKVTVYDPCCGGGYLLTVLGFQHGDKISALYGSDISAEAVRYAADNLNLLSGKGMNERIRQLTAMRAAYGKESHLRAIQHANELAESVNDDIKCAAFVRDILQSDVSGQTAETTPHVSTDIVITDVPYGSMAQWSGGDEFAIDVMLNNIYDNLKPYAIVAVISDKQQSINNPRYKRVEKFIIGKRKIEILKKYNGR